MTTSRKGEEKKRGRQRDKLERRRQRGDREKQGREMLAHGQGCEDGQWHLGHITCQQGSAVKANNFSIQDFSPQFNNNKKVKAACLLLPRDRTRGVYFAPSLQSSLL